jgi:hypothetical protein
MRLQYECSVDETYEAFYGLQSCEEIGWKCGQNRERLDAYFQLILDISARYVQKCGVVSPAAHLSNVSLIVTVLVPFFVTCNGRLSVHIKF